MSFFSFNNSDFREIAPGIRMRSAHLQQAMLTYFEFEPGAVIPPHKHPHEQITLILEGEMGLTVGEETRVLKAGEGAAIPPFVQHKAVILSRPTRAVDAWYPVREDYVL